MGRSPGGPAAGEASGSEPPAWRVLAGYARPHGRMLVLGAVLNLATAASGLALPLVVRELIAALGTDRGVGGLVALMTLLMEAADPQEARAALAGALDAGRLGGVALDAYVTEPPDVSHPVFRHPRAVFMPHSGADTVEALENVGLMNIADIQELMAGGRPARVLNPEVFEDRR